MNVSFCILKDMTVMEHFNKIKKTLRKIPLGIKSGPGFVECLKKVSLRRLSFDQKSPRLRSRSQMRLCQKRIAGFGLALKQIPANENPVRVPARATQSLGSSRKPSRTRILLFPFG
jgi:hypothetical protein